MDQANLNGQALEGLVVLTALGATAQWLAWRLRLPSILVLMLVGFVAGPVTGLIVPDRLLGSLTFPIVSLGAAIVLFEGGLTTSWQGMLSVAAPVRRLVTLGLLVTWASSAVAAHFLLGLDLELSALLGAVLVVTGPTVIGPLLIHSRPHGVVGRILKYEGLVNDPLGAILAVLTYQVIAAEQVENALSHVVLGVLRATGLGSLIGLGAAWGYVQLRKRGWLPEHLVNAVLLPLALGVYALSNGVQHESGLLAVTILGVALSSQRSVNVQANLEFAEHARTLLISMLFVLLTARMKLSDLERLPAGVVVFVAAVILVVRPVAVAISTLGTGLSWRERAFLAAMAPRGIVAAAVASVFGLTLVNAGRERAELLMPVTFLVIAACVAVYGLSSRPMVRWLKLEQRSPNGVLLLGANRVARQVATCLREQGLRVVLVDQDRKNVRRARNAGLVAHHGRLLSEHVLNRLDLDEIGRFVALSSNDDANTLGVAHFRALFGPDRVHQVVVDDSMTLASEGYASELRGHPLGGGITYHELAHRTRRGAKLRVDLVDGDEPSRKDGGRSRGEVELFVLDAAGALSDSGDRSLRKGDRVLSLAAPSG